MAMAKKSYKAKIKLHKAKKDHHHKMMKLHDGKLKDLLKEDSKMHKVKAKLHKKEEKVSKKEDKVHHRLERGENKMKKVMHEFKEGALHSGSKKGPQVQNRKQAIAIALSEARKARKKRK
jgi:hypothetical protein